MEVSPPPAFIPSQDAALAVVYDILILSSGTLKYLSILYFLDSSLLVKILLLLLFFFCFFLFLILFYF